MIPTPKDREPKHVYGTLLEVVADAMIEAKPWTVIVVEDEEGNRHSYLVSHWGQC